MTAEHIIFVAICHQEVNKINATKILILNIQLLCWYLCSEIFVTFLIVYQEKLFYVGKNKKENILMNRFYLNLIWLTALENQIKQN